MVFQENGKLNGEMEILIIITNWLQSERSCERKRDDMGKRFVSIWFPHLATDWFALRQPRLKTVPFVLRTSSHGRMVITAANSLAQSQGVFCGMVLADARALIPSLEVLDDKPDLIEKLLHRLAEWCIRFSPYVVVDTPDGLLLDVTGCTYLWGGDHQYLITMTNRLRDRGYTVRLAMADTIGACHAVARFGSRSFIIETGKQVDAILALPPESLRIEQDIIERL